MTLLKPCPFCGVKPLRIDWPEIYYLVKHKPECFLQGMDVDRIFDPIIEFWNKRAKDEKEKA